jgi:hypothetical protein
MVNHAADDSSYKRSKKIMLSLEDDQAPLRITQTRYIRRKHNEIPERMITGNDEVKALSYCDRCHTQAERGSYDDDEVRIPGYGRWED